MSISFIAKASADGGSASTTADITHGLTLLSGDILIAALNINGTTTPTDNNGSTPFTDDHSTANPDTANFFIKHRVCGASEPAAYHWNLSPATRWCVVLRQYRGVDLVNIWDVAPSASSRSTAANQATAISPSLTILGGGSAALALMGDDFAPTTTTFTSIDNSFGNTGNESGQQYVSTADKLGLVPGSVGTTTITSSANVSYVFYLVSLRAALVPNKFSSVNQALKRSTTY